MRATVVTCVFPPEPVVSAQTSLQIARALAGRGHQVTVIAPVPCRPIGTWYPGYSSRLVEIDRSFEEFEMWRCRSIPSRRSTTPSRVLENLSFGILSLLVLRSMPTPDVVYSNSWPLVATGMIADHCSARQIPLFLNVQDLYPETMVIQGRLRRDSCLAKAMMRRDRRNAQLCQRVNLISRRLAEQYARTRQVKPGKITVIPNWVADDLVVVDPVASQQFRSDCGIADTDFLLVYGGSISAASGVETLVRAFSRVTQRDQLRLLIAGSGSNLGACRALAADDPRIHFHAPYTLAQNAPLLGAADVLILPTAGQQALAALPSKLLSYMQSARPIVALAPPESDLADTISSAGCGWVVEPDSPQRLAQTICAVRDLPQSELQRKGRAGREYCATHYGERSCLDRMVRELEALATI